MIDFVTFTKKIKNVGDFGKLIVAKGFKKLPNVQKIAQSGHTVWNPNLCKQSLYHSAPLVTPSLKGPQ